MFRWILLLALAIAAVVGLAVGVMNPDPVTVKLPGAELELPLGALLLAVLSVGLVAGFVVFFFLFHLPARLKSARRSSSVLRNSSSDPNA